MAREDKSLGRSCKSLWNVDMINVNMGATDSKFQAEWQKKMIQKQELSDWGGHRHLGVKKMLYPSRQHVIDFDWSFEDGILGRHS